MTITIYHNPRCGTSRNTLALLEEKGIKPIIIEYLKTPPQKQELLTLIALSGEPVRYLIRAKESLYQELDLDNHNLTDDQLIDALLAHPILLNRPIVSNGSKAVVCRPSEKVLEIL